MYQGNIFSFRGTDILHRFKESIPLSHWDIISHINISTIFTRPEWEYHDNHGIPPEGFDRWVKTCALIEQLKNLKTLIVDIIVWVSRQKGDTKGPIKEAMIATLQPLNSIRAKTFRVKLSMPAPAAVRDQLGPLNFELD